MNTLGLSYVPPYIVLAVRRLRRLRRAVAVLPSRDGLGAIQTPNLSSFLSLRRLQLHFLSPPTSILGTNPHNPPLVVGLYQLPRCYLPSACDQVQCGDSLRRRKLLNRSLRIELPSARNAMAITSVQNVLPGRYAINSTEKNAAKPPPKIYNVQEPPFKGYHPPQPEGYEQSRSKADSTAIVIDNGAFNDIVHHVRTTEDNFLTTVLHRLQSGQGRLVV